MEPDPSLLLSEVGHLGRSAALSQSSQKMPPPGGSTIRTPGPRQPGGCRKHPPDGLLTLRSVVH